MHISVVELQSALRAQGQVEVRSFPMPRAAAATADGSNQPNRLAARSGGHLTSMGHARHVDFESIAVTVVGGKDGIAAEGAAEEYHRLPVQIRTAGRIVVTVD